MLNYQVPTNNFLNNYLMVERLSVSDVTKCAIDCENQVSHRSVQLTFGELLFLSDPNENNFLMFFNQHHFRRLLHKTLIK